MIGIDLFSGAGGLSLGAAQAGIDVCLSVEADIHAAATYAHNHPHTKVFSKDIRSLNQIDIKKNGAPKILFGGPPCQGFSTSNQRTRTSVNPNNWLFLEFIRIVRLWKPDWVVFENVKGIIETEQGNFFKEIVRHFEACGYSINKWLLNAADFGVPQSRNRLFLVCSLNGTKVAKPCSNTHQYITVKDAISDLPDLSNGASAKWMPYKGKACSEYARKMRGGLNKSSNHLVTRNSPQVIERYRHISQGGNWENIPERLMKNYSNRTRCHTGIYRRLKEDEPSIVLGNYRKNMLIHPIQNRGLSVREAARLQSFPDWYEFKGSIGFQQQQVGNAVPPLLAKVVFDSIIDNIILA